MTPRSPAPVDSSRFGKRRPVSRGAWALAIVLHILVFTLIFLQKNEPFVRMSEHGLNAFLLPKAHEGTKEAQTEQPLKKQRQVSQKTPDQPQPEQPPAPAPPVVKDFQFPFIQLSRSDFAASDVSRMASQRRAASGETADAADSKATYGPGAGPGGAVLYPADWYREPTDTELGSYIRPDQPSRGWGQIACKTVARYHVEDCYILGESPMGSGYGRSVLNAAWQFLVQPPRINGHPQVGTWVSIRITYSPAGASAGSGG